MLLKDVLGKKVYTYLKEHNSNLYQRIKKSKAKIDTSLRNPPEQQSVEKFLKEHKEYRELVWEGIQYFNKHRDI